MCNCNKDRCPNGQSSLVGMMFAGNIQLGTGKTYTMKGGNLLVLDERQIDDLAVMLTLSYDYKPSYETTDNLFYYYRDKVAQWTKTLGEHELQGIEDL